MFIFSKKKRPQKLLDILGSKNNNLKKIVFSDDQTNFGDKPSLIKCGLPKKSYQNQALKLLGIVLILFLILGLILIFHKTTPPKIDLSKNSAEFQNFYEKIYSSLNTNNNINDGSNIFNPMGQFFDFIKDKLALIPEMINNFYNVLISIDVILKNWPDIIFGIYDRGLLRENFLNLSKAINEFKNGLYSEGLQKFSDNPDLFFWQVEINRLANFLDNFINWMDASPRNLIILFLNPSEMRPGGGFLGSYAELKIDNWKIESIKILDINEADREFKERIIPPWPLQNKIKSWKAADANWFFDFPLSISKIINFLERSEFYKKNNIQFDGAIILTPEVIRDILGVVGPIKIENNIFSADNFLFQIQTTIQNQREAKNVNPKFILDKLFAAIADKIKLLDEGKKKQIANDAYKWIKNRELAIYLKDEKLYSFFKFYGLTPQFIELEPDFFGEYLAVVDANLASGKSDIFINKKVDFRLYLTESGFLTSELEIKRENKASEKDAWWYKAPNEDFIQIFTPANAEILSAFGGENKKIYPLVNYKTQGYREDPDLNYEKNQKEISDSAQIKKYVFKDKNVFGTFITTLSGETKVLSLKYARRLNSSLKDNKAFTFILDKQIGDRGSYNIEIYAPIGFRFKENNSSLFQYESKNAWVPEIIKLTLIEEGF